MTHVPVVMNHLIERLRSRQYGESEPYTLESEAADAIQALQARCRKAFEEGRDFQAQVESQLRRERDAALAQPEPCTNDEWLANCPQKVRDFAAKVKAEKEQK